MICGPTAPSSKGLEVLRGGLAPVGKPKAGEGFVFFPVWLGEADPHNQLLLLWHQTLKSGNTFLRL